jgi:hypothetical protein
MSWKRTTEETATIVADWIYSKLGLKPEEIWFDDMDYLDTEQALNKLLQPKVAPEEDM